MPSASAKATKKPKKHFLLTFGGRVLSGIVWIDLGGELIVKPLVGKARKHLSLFQSQGKLHRHVTHEEYALGQRHRHTQKATISPEVLANRIFCALAPKDDPPPPITSFVDEREREMGALTEWLERIWPRLFRETTDSPVNVIKGPLGAFLDNAFTTQKMDKFNLDLEPLARYYASAETEKDVYTTIGESNLRLDGHRFAFSEDWSKLIFLVTENMVLELDVERMETAVEENLRALGFDGFFRALRRKGNSFVDEPAVLEQREQVRRLQQLGSEAKLLVDGKTG